MNDFSIGDAAEQYDQPTEMWDEWFASAFEQQTETAFLVGLRAGKAISEERFRERHPMLNHDRFAEIEDGERAELVKEVEELIERRLPNHE